MCIKVNGIMPDRYQLRAINSNKQNLLVVAGAGSGKTFTIIGKIKKLIYEGVLPEEILCISFTKASAKSLEEKLKAENVFVKVKTFHSLGFEIIKKYRDVKLADSSFLSDLIFSYLRKEKHLREISGANFIRLGYPDDVFNRLENNIVLNSNYGKRLGDTIFTFINLYKSGNFKISDFKKFERYNQNNHIYDQKKRHVYFLSLVKRIILKYKRELYKNKLIDFHDMINLASNIVKKQGIYPYKYIIVDEYQDSSLNKVELLLEIQKKTGAKLMAVGDDWQSIYGFTGSNLDVFTNFKKMFKHSKVIKLKNTYRNSKELLRVTSDFICKNPYQIRKRLRSSKRNKYPINICYYDNDIGEVWDRVCNLENVLVLGRNNKDINLISKFNRFKFLTMHKAKGLESDNVIIVNLVNSYDSIPCKIDDSEFLVYVKPMLDSFKYAEERRLFYVALTRCKNSNYLLVKRDNPSIFIRELIRNYSRYINFIN